MDSKNSIERSSGPVTLVAEPASWRAAAPLPPADPLSSALNAREYLRVLYKHRWMILTAIAVMVTVVTVATFRMVPVYEASSRLEINGEMPDLTSLRDLFTIMPTDEEFLQTQARILQSDDLAMQTVRALRLHDRPEFSVRPANAQSAAPFSPIEEVQLIGLFKAGLGVQLIRSSRLVELKYSSADPKLAADIVNAHADTYIETNFRKKYESTLQASDWMAGQLKELRLKMEKSHGALVGYEKENQIFAVSDGQNVTMQKLSELSRELTLAQSERFARESQWRLVQSRRLDDLPAVAQNAFIQTMLQRQAELNDQFAEMRATFGPKYPKVQQVERQLEEAQRQLDTEKQKVANRIESEYQAAMQRETLLHGAVEGQKNEANVMNARLVEYNLLKREYETNQQLYENLLQRLKEAGISAGLRSNNVHVVDRARPPLAPVRPRKLLNISVSLMVGILLGCVLALFNEYLDNSVKTPEEVEQLVSLPALGIIPAVGSVNGRSAQRVLPGPESKASTSDLATIVHPQSVVSEAYRALRTSILLSTSKHPPQVILITSGQPREGKTTTALNLSITLAQRGDRVVLIDSDLRRPRVHRAFQMTNQVGLSSYLAGAATIDQIVKPVTRLPNLFVITAGPTPPNPAELLSSEPVNVLFEELRRQFDFVVLDSPPAITVADAMILAAHADGVIIVAHGGVTTRDSLRHARKLLSAANARMLGVVLNNVDMRSADYKYYYSYYYGDYYRHMVDGYGYGQEPEDKRQRKGA